MMNVLKSSAFELFVGFSDSLRFYLLVGLSTFLNEEAFRALNSDILISLCDPKVADAQELNDWEKTRVTEHIHFHHQYD